MSARILLVDDETEMRKLLQVCLASNNYELEEASNGEEALSKIKSTEYDLILLDIMMPEI
ncbi:response regulator, partial [Pseudomonas sp. 2822-15]|uniref:response regulator n=1 Tax=Pseudomonas sp. 2822-15 TaxID=1712677 RepID=UPI001179DB0C